MIVVFVIARCIPLAMLVIRRVWMEWNTLGKKTINFYKGSVYVCSYNYSIKFLKIVGKFKRNEIVFQKQFQFNTYNDRMKC